VEDLNGGGVLAGARVEVTFDPGDQDTSIVTGFSGCNRFTGRWWQQGAAVKFGPLAGTRMACAPAVNDFESKFLATMQAVSLVSFGPEGVALLRSSDGQVIQLRKRDSGGQPVE
jgi:heat shock protein HslJ